MNLPGGASLVYLAFVLLFLPWAAYRNRGVIAQVGQTPEGSDKPLVTRAALYASTLFSLAILLFLSVVTGRTFGYQVFVLPRLEAREVLAGLAALGVSLVLMLLSYSLRTPEERRSMVVYRMLPRTPGEWAAYSAMCGAAGVAEEAAYRGVVVAILWHSLGSFWGAILISAVAFAVAHSVQGWKSGLIIFAMALAMHALVFYTGTLVVAMVVHALYDVIAGIVGAWRIRNGHVESA